MTNEATYEAWFHNRVRLLGGQSFKFAPLVKGNPDRIVLMPGSRMFLVELKTPTGSLSTAQKVWHNKAARLGTPVYVLTNRGEALQWFRDITEQHRVSIDAMTRKALADGLYPIDEMTP